MLTLRNFRPVLAIAATTLLAACAVNPIPPSDLSGLIENQSQPPQVAREKATFAFDQISGAPGNIADDLATYIGRAAQVRQLKLIRRIGAPSTYRVKGFLSAAGTNYNTTVFYVFDVVDSTGNRIHRIQGQEQSAGSAGDPWTAINSRVLQRIADRSVSGLQAWLHSK